MRLDRRKRLRNEGIGEESRGLETRMTETFARVSPTESLILFVIVFQQKSCTPSLRSVCRMVIILSRCSD